MDSGEAGAVVNRLRVQEEQDKGNNPYFEPIWQDTADAIINAVAARLAADEVLHDALWDFRSDGFQDATLALVTNRGVWVVRHHHEDPLTVEAVAFGSPVKIGRRQLTFNAGPKAPWVPPPGSTPPGWYADPYRRHQHRWWSGAEWTKEIADNGVAGTELT
jgi:hypothetical protein